MNEVQAELHRSGECFLIHGNKPAGQISDAKSGIIRRLIDVNPTGKRLRTTTRRSRHRSTSSSALSRTTAGKYI